jgi:hypothetical protein
MGILSMIQQKKEHFHNATVERRKNALMNRTEKIHADNLRQSELLEARQKMNDAKQINQDLRGSSPVQPSGLQKFGRGLADVMNKQKAKKDGKSIAQKSAGKGKMSKGQKSRMLGAMQNGGSQGSIFGGQRNIDVGSGAGSPFNQPGRDLFGTRPQAVAPKQTQMRPKTKTIIRY